MSGKRKDLSFNTGTFHRTSQLLFLLEEYLLVFNIWFSYEIYVSFQNVSANPYRRKGSLPHTGIPSPQPRRWEGETVWHLAVGLSGGPLCLRGLSTRSALLENPTAAAQPAAHRAGSDCWDGHAVTLLVFDGDT